MSGILDRKSRLLDYTITSNGRSQMQDGDIRFVYATVSDKSIVYEKDFDLSLLNKEDIAYDKMFLPLEVSSKLNDELNPEFDLDKTFSKTNGNILNLERSQNESLSDISFDTAVTNNITRNDLGNRLSNLDYLTTKNLLGSDKLEFEEDVINSPDFDFVNVDSLTKYNTVKHASMSANDLNVIANDKRFSHKTNFKKLIPVNSSGQELYDVEMFKDLDTFSEDNIIENIFTFFNSNININSITTREDLILNVINALKNDASILKRSYTLKKKSELDSIIFSIYEEDESHDELEKLSIVKLGDFYNKQENKIKKVYLAGKIINTRNNSEDLDVLFNFNNGVIQNNTANKTFAISAYYSFLCMFTIVIE
jgi:hypothetical protein